MRSDCANNLGICLEHFNLNATSFKLHDTSSFLASQNKVLKNTDPITLHLTVKLGAAHVQLAIFYKRLVVATNTIDFLLLCEKRFAICTFIGTFIEELA